MRPPPFHSAADPAQGRDVHAPELSKWRHGPFIRTLVVAVVLAGAAASAGMLMALLGD